MISLLNRIYALIHHPRQYKVFKYLLNILLDVGCLFDDVSQKSLENHCFFFFFLISLKFMVCRGVCICTMRCVSDSASVNINLLFSSRTLIYFFNKYSYSFTFTFLVLLIHFPKNVFIFLLLCTVVLNCVVLRQKVFGT